MSLNLHAAAESESSVKRDGEQRQRLFHPLDFYYLLRVAAALNVAKKIKMRRSFYFNGKNVAENVNQAPTKHKK